MLVVTYCVTRCCRGVFVCARTFAHLPGAIRPLKCRCFRARSRTLLPYAQPTQWQSHLGLRAMAKCSQELSSVRRSDMSSRSPSGLAHCSSHYADTEIQPG